MNIKDFKEQLENDKKELEAKPFYIRIPIKFWDSFWYRGFARIPDMFCNLKWWLQDHIRGYSDNDVWDVGHFVTRKTYGPLMEFVKNYEEHGMSLPTEFSEDPGAWLMILKKIQYSFEWKHREDFDFDEFLELSKDWSNEQRIEHYKKEQEGFELFGKFLNNLWD